MSQIRRTCPYLGIRFFGHNSVIFGLWANLAVYFVEAHDAIIYRLVIKNSSYNTYFLILICWALLAGKWAWPTSAPDKCANGLGPPKSEPNRKVGPLGGPFRSTVTLNHVFKSCRPEHPPLALKRKFDSEIMYFWNCFIILWSYNTFMQMSKLWKN